MKKNKVKNALSLMGWCFLVVSVIVSMGVVSCNIIEDFTASKPVVDLLGLDYSACIGDGFDVCLEFLLDNDERLIGQDIDSTFLLELIQQQIQDLNTNG